MLRSCRFCTCWLAESPRSRLSSCSTNWAADSLAFQPIGAKEKASTAGPQLRVCRLDVDRSNQRTVVSFLLLLFFSFFFSVRATSFFFFHSLVRQRHLRSTRPQFFLYFYLLPWKMKRNPVSWTSSHLMVIHDQVKTLYILWNRNSKLE